MSLLQRTIQKLREIPRIGNLNQYSHVPRPLNNNYQDKIRLKLNQYPRISIVTPSFNQGVFIEKTILSILDQKYPNLEYFIQDGGSKDTTIEVLKKYENQLSGWITEKDSGQSQAINRGFERTNGEIMAWLNSDDLLLPNTLYLVADYFNRHPEIDVVYGNRLLINENDMEIGRWIMPGHNGKVLLWADYVPQETLFWRRRIWEKVDKQIDESFQFAMDWDLLVRFLDVEAKFAHIPQFIGCFRVHKHQKTLVNMTDIGHKEMDRIRKRVLGSVPTRKELFRATLPFLLKHVIVDLGYRVRMRFKV